MISYEEILTNSKMAFRSLFWLCIIAFLTLFGTGAWVMFTHPATDSDQLSAMGYLGAGEMVLGIIFLGTGMRCGAQRERIQQAIDEISMKDEGLIRSGVT